MMDDSVFSVVVDVVAEEGSTKCETVKNWWYLMSALSWTEQTLTGTREQNQALNSVHC